MNFKEVLKKDNILSFLKEKKAFIITVAVAVILIFAAFFVGLLIGSSDNKTPEIKDAEKVVFNEVVEPSEDSFVNSGDATTLQGRSYGVDVSKWQGVIDWKKVKNSGIQFAIIRIGFRGEDGIIREDDNARYNVQEAYKNGVMVGVYFYSTAINEEEVIEEAEWTLDFIEGYGISYPVVYDCEGFRYDTSRMYGITAEQRTDYALKFLDLINQAGYDAMFYGAATELQNSEYWQIERIEPKYKIWVAKYSKITYPVQDMPVYDGRIDAWQFSNAGTVDGIGTDVDLVVCYFKKKFSLPKNFESVQNNDGGYINDGFYLYKYTNDYVTAKIETNIRNAPSLESSDVLYLLKNGEKLRRIGICEEEGWSLLEYNGEVAYAVSSYLLKVVDLK